MTCGAWPREWLGVIRVETLWLSVVPRVMRDGMDTLLAQVEQVFGKARQHRPDAG